MSTRDSKAHSPRTDGGADCDDAPDLEALREAFMAGFTTGRTGKYFGTIPDISRRAAETKFELYYQHRFE